MESRGIYNEQPFDPTAAVLDSETSLYGLWLICAAPLHVAESSPQ